MTESPVLSQIEAAASHFKICVLPRNPKSLSCSVWSMPDPAFHVGVIWRQNAGAMKNEQRFIRFGPPGMADFSGWLFKTGQRIQIEAKSASGSLSADQRIHRDLCLRTDVLWGLVRSYDDAVKLFESWELRRPA